MLAEIMRRNGWPDAIFSLPHSFQQVAAAAAATTEDEEHARLDLRAGEFLREMAQVLKSQLSFLAIKSSVVAGKCSPGELKIVFEWDVYVVLESKHGHSRRFI